MYEGHILLYRESCSICHSLFIYGDNVVVAIISVFNPTVSCFRSVTVSEGLSHNTINAIYKDTRGFVWLGTQMGLDRFDGVNVTTYPQFSGRTVFR